MSKPIAPLVVPILLIAEGLCTWRDPLAALRPSLLVPSSGVGPALVVVEQLALLLDLASV
eukprot:8925623-Prorocentrum_lima.AAC.1